MVFDGCEVSAYVDLPRGAQQGGFVEAYEDNDDAAYRFVAVVEGGALLARVHGWTLELARWSPALGVNRLQGRMPGQIYERLDIHGGAYRSVRLMCSSTSVASESTMTPERREEARRSEECLDRFPCCVPWDVGPSLDPGIPCDGGVPVLPDRP